MILIFGAFARATVFFIVVFDLVFMREIFPVLALLWTIFFFDERLRVRVAIQEGGINFLCYPSRILCKSLFFWQEDAMP